MNNRELYLYRKANGLCWGCGEIAEPGKTRCLRCAQIATAKEKMRREENIKLYGDDYRQAKREYQKSWAMKNPEKVAVYKDRKSEYNRKYNRTTRRGCL